MMSQAVEGTSGLKELFFNKAREIYCSFKVLSCHRGGVVVAFCSV